MGEKKDLKRALEEERAVSAAREREANELVVRVRELEQENQSLALAPALPGDSYRLSSDPVDERMRGRIAKALGVVMPAGEIITDEVILDAIERMRAPSAGAGDTGDSMVYRRGETLADAVAHNRAEREDLLGRLTQANAIVSRLASALQVGQWDKDGTEIVEKAQRFSVFAHWLKKRLADATRNAELAHRVDAGDVAIVEREAIICELRTVIAGLVAEKDLARYIQSKPQKVGGIAFQEATEPAARALTGEMWLDKPYTPAEFGSLCALVRDALDLPGGRRRCEDEMLALLESIRQSSAVTTELVDFMNLVVLPALRRLHIATSQPPAVH